MNNRPKNLWCVFANECKEFVFECVMPLIIVAKKIWRCLRK
ncbi:hypothetical protein SAMN04487926_13527 [Paraburkholderia steynii]|uniref:Uncharacterized protein n=1 Tax=Paraburkholderia steynii TaxID=1245441 RepID=A0A7Z7BG07_9BURK|nr:hypothetical protein SAMN04487926_13527 [Paraburkholderia steynii]